MTFFIVVELLVIVLIGLVVVVGVVDAVGNRSWRLRLPLAGGDGGLAALWRRLVATPRERYFAPRTPPSTTYRLSAGAGAADGAELLLEFVSPEATQLDSSFAASVTDVASLEAIVDAIPDGRPRLELGAVVRLVGPAEVIPLAARSQAELATPSGDLIGPMRDGAALERAGRSRIERAEPVSAPTAAALLEARLPASAFLRALDGLLAPARENTARLLHRQRADAFEKCAGAARLCAEVRRELIDDPNRGAADDRDLRAADRLVARPYEQARTSLVRFAERVGRFTLAEAKPATLRGLWKRATEVVLDDARLLASCAAVRYEQRLLAAVAQVRADPRHAAEIAQEIERRRRESVADLACVMAIITTLSLSRTTLEQRYRRGTARIVRNAETFKRRTRPMRRLVEEADAALLPPAPKLDLGFLIEISARPEGPLAAVESPLVAASAAEWMLDPDSA